ncbi:hypothetical protein K788_0006348 [Paraburkholderia caribensis MBA4]|uniref:Uncharacterized protein n=1 Tax=Paraburkholderia caribensis MBA4 TaxID=1323664 RepID=A0A0P0RGG8_9BURK|nr:hypothetical protein K788_0006348 [Paraburkholderia caribensis MBA4]
MIFASMRETRRQPAFMHALSSIAVQNTVAGSPKVSQSYWQHERPGAGQKDS